MTEWREKKLGDVALFIDYRGKTPRKTSVGIPLITAKIVKNGTILPPNEFIASEDYDAWMTRGLPQIGDVVLTTEAPLGEVAQLKDAHVALAQRIITLRANADVLDNTFLKYFLQSAEGQRRLKMRESGTTVTGIKSSELQEVLIPLPDLETQKRIVRILSSLDNKIEVNNQINRNLEEQAKAIFKSWFVDFDPFGGKQPDDWKHGTIADLGKVTGGGTPSKAKDEYYSPNGIPWITPKDLSVNKSKFISHGQTDISDAGLNNSSAIIMPKGTVLFSSRAPIGYIAIAKNEVTTNQGFKSVVPHPHVGTPFVYMFLKHNLEKIESVASGSTFKEVSGSVMKSIPALIPDSKTLALFTEKCQPLFRQQESLEAENTILQETRDTLLPKLLSGEINI